MTRLIDAPKRPKIVGTFIRQRRETLGLSQRALGLLFDPPVTTQFISNVERGVTPLPPAHVPTLTKALQVGESEMMALLEKEYTLKLSGRLGLSADSEANGRGAVIIPLSQAMGGVDSSCDLEFIQNLFEAYRTADSDTRRAFTEVCQSMLNVHVPVAATNNHAVASKAMPISVAALGTGDRTQS